MSADESTDPALCWGEMTKAINKLSHSSQVKEDKKKAIEHFLGLLPKIFISLPQTVCSTPLWPDTPQLAAKRRGFILATVRRVVHLAAGAEAGDLAMEVEALHSLLSVLEDRSLVVWRKLLIQLILFWRGLSEASQQDLDVPGATQSIGILVTEDEVEDETFSQDLRKIELNRISVIERLQTLVSKVCMKQLRNFSQDITHMSIVHTVALNQLEFGGAQLKAVTLELLTELHQCPGCDLTNFWSLETELLVKLLELIVSPDLQPQEVELLSSAMTDLLTKLLPLMERRHLLILAIPLVPFWETKLANLPAGLSKLINHIIRNILDQKPTKKLMEKIKRNVTSSPSLDWDLMASLAVSECLQSEMFQDCQRDDRLTAELLSSSWSFLSANIERKLCQVSELESFARVVRKLLIALIAERPDISIDILSLDMMEKVTETVTEALGIPGCVLPGLQCLEVMIQCCLLIPPLPSLSSLHQSWAALLARPWLSRLTPSLQSDLKIPSQANIRHSLASNSATVSWRPEETNKALRLLSFLPPHICPRFRLSVLKEAWAQQAQGVIESLPALTGISSSAGDFAREVIRDLTEKDQPVDVVLSLTSVCSSYICSLAKRTVPCLVSPAQGQLELSLRCLDCSPRSEDSSSTAATSSVASRELESVMRLVGHQDSRVRLAMVKIIPAAAAHCLITQQATHLWMNSVSDSDKKTRTIFAANVGHILSGRRDTLSEDLDQIIVTRLQEVYPSNNLEILDSYIITLVTVYSALVDEKVQLKVLDLLLGLFVNKETTESFSLSSLSCLFRAMQTQKHHILSWTARAMAEAGGEQEAKAVLSCLLLLCEKGTEQSFLSENLRYILPSIILCSEGDNSSVDTALDLISRVTGQNGTLMVMYNFPVVFQSIMVEARDQAHLQRCIQYIEVKTGHKLSELFLTNRQMVLVELLTMIQVNKPRVVKGLAMCAMADSKGKMKDENIPQDEVADYVASYLQAVLASFITKCSNPLVRNSDKVQCLRSLVELITFLKFKNVNTCKYALMDCMKLATNLSRKDPEVFEDVALKLWNTFIHTFEMSALVGVLPQIICRILPHLQTRPTETVEMFRFLLRDQADLIKHQHNQLMFLQRIPELNKILSTVRGGELQLRDSVQGLTDCLESESVDVRLQTLLTLSSLLDDNMGGLQGLVVCSDRTDPLVSNLLHRLMTAISPREPDSEVRNLAGLCLGKLGPVDPGKLDFEVNLGGGAAEISSRNQMLEIFSVGFCQDLLTELVRAQASAREPLTAESCSYSIQEVLKVYKFNLQSKNPEDFTFRVWRKLPDSTQEKLSPLLSSLYKHQPGPRPELKCPLYLSEQGRTYKDWLLNLSLLLISLISDQRTKQLFQVCLPALKKDLTIGDLLLPRIVIAVLCECKAENNSRLLAEIRAIITNTDIQEAEEKQLQQSVAAAVFLVQDHLRLWTRTKFNSLMAATRKSDSQLEPMDIQAALNKSKEYCSVAGFIREISNEDLANFCYEVRAYQRSAFHFDLYLKSRGSQPDQTCLASLQRLYVGLEEPDLISGVAAVREEPGLREQMELHKATGNYPDALTCLQLLRSGDTEDQADLISAYLSLSQPNMASTIAEELSRRLPEAGGELVRAGQAEAAWQLGQWDQLELTVKAAGQSGTGWQLGLSGILLAIKRGDWTNMRGQMEQVRQEVVESITSSSLEHGAYQRSYQRVNQLGMLYEVQLIAENFLLCSTKQLAGSSQASTELLSELSTRLTYTQSSWNILEPILRLRRCCLALAEDRVRPYNTALADRLHQELGDSWLQSARLARKSSMLQESYRLLLEAKRFSNCQTFQEHAKLLWDRDQKTAAIGLLRKGLTDNFPEVEAALLEESSSHSTRHALQSLSKPEKEVLCRGKMLLAEYLEEAANVSSDGIGAIYQQAKSIAGNNEEVFFRYGQSIDKQIQRLTDEQQLQYSDLVLHTCVNYLKSIMNGPTHLYHCLPRMLTIWLDFAEVVHKAIEANKSEKNTDRLNLLNNADKNLEKIVKVVKTFIKQIPIFYLLTALPQIVSRICHPHLESYQALSSMMVSLLCSRYSQQTFWHLVGSSKNSDKNRSSRCLNIFKEAGQKDPDNTKFLRDALEFAEKVDQLCELPTEKGNNKLSLKSQLPSLPKMFKRSGFAGSLILPIERNMLATLPTVEGKAAQHNPFPSGLVCMEGMEDSVTVMQSMVRPRKIILRGTDGKEYPFLAKPKDDLRRDSRFMDCMRLLNRLFRKDVKARGRNLHIRTYTVVSTNPSSGLIEWVGNLQAIRSIIMKLYKENGLNPNFKFTEKYRPSEKASLDEKKKRFRQIQKDLKSPVFSQWFVNNFSDPQSWLMARMSYVYSTAVISMMGYIIGLGDRHLENINVDTTTGETFHVDLNCLFNKGEELPVPEVTPFRLTSNMVDAFGPLGIEGPFRLACEISLSVMRKEKDLIMSVLRPFVYDPLVDWTKSKAGGSVGTSHLKRVEDRLSGIVTEPLANKAKKRKKSLLGHPLSVAGQVSHLISEATDEDNLASMFWNWSPYF